MICRNGRSNADRFNVCADKRNASDVYSLNVPTSGGGTAKIQRDFAVVDGVFKLTNRSTELVLAAVVKAGAEEVVLNRGGSDITFLRP